MAYHEKEPRLINFEQDKSKLRKFKMEKAVWAPYTNMARQNMYQTLYHISRVLGLDVTNADEERLLLIPCIVLLKSKGKAEQKVKAMRMIDKHFPFIPPMIERWIELKYGEKDRNGNLFIPNNKKQPTPKLYYEVFEFMLPLLNLMRNYFTHYEFFSDKINKNGELKDAKMCERVGNLAQLLDYALTGARRTVKERFNVKEDNEKTPKDVNNKTSNKKDGPVFIKSDFDFFEQGNRYYDRCLTDKNNMTIIEKGREKTTKVERKGYIYKVTYKKENENFVRMTNMGLYLFLCLFLTKKYAKEFGDKTDFWGTKLPKRPTDKEILIMHETSCVYRMHLPKNRMESNRPDSALALDMLGELKKCPRELFDTLSASDQNRFRVKEKTDDGTVLMLRSHDRFAYHALSYLDTMKKFSSIRFQIDLGNYRYKFYDKDWVDKDLVEESETNEDRVRILQKEMVGYGRLSEIEEERKVRWENLIRLIDKPRADTTDTKPYITDHHASYHIENNHIGLQWNEDGKGILDRKSIFMPDTTLPEWVNDDTKKKDLDNPADKVALCHPPKAWLSVYDLPAVCFLTYLTGSGECAERIIIETTNNYNRLFKDIYDGILVPSDEVIPSDVCKDIVLKRAMAKNYSYVLDKYKIDIADLPGKIQDYLLGVDSISMPHAGEKWGNATLKPKDVKHLEDFLKNHRSGDVSEKRKELAMARLQQMLSSTKDKLERYKSDYKMYASKDNKVGKKSHVDIRQGTLARYLAKDMMLFKEPDADGKVKLTSQNFNILQAELALYRMSFDELHAFFVKCDLLCGSKPHPFLQKVMDRMPHSFYQFYTYYLEEKVNQLEKWIVKSKTGLHFLHPNREKWQTRNEDFFKKLAGKYTTIELPSGIFDDAIVEELHGLEEAWPALKKALSAERKNVSFLINAFMDAIGSGHQQFYDYKRCYKYFCMVKNPVLNRKKQLQERFLTVDNMRDFLEKNADKEKRNQEYLNLLDKQKNEDLRNADRERNYKKKDRKKKSILEAYSESVEAAYDKLNKAYRFYTENEKTIRRQKTQDGLLFLLAKEVLTDLMKLNNTAGYKLSDIGKDSEADILSMQLPFSIKLEIPTNEGLKTVTIKQDDLKLKNYGDFFRFIYDIRIKPLLSQTKIDTIDREELEKELDHYDQNRIPLFELVHDIEKKAQSGLTEEQCHPKDENGKSIKVDFKYLLQFVDLKESDKDMLKTIRNAFCHSTYPEHSSLEIVVEEEKDIPNVAKTLVKDFEHNCNKVRKK